MKWKYCLSMFLERHCSARGLQPKTILAYHDALMQFRRFIRVLRKRANPDQVTAKDILEYVDYLRTVRKNQNASVNRHVTIIKNFYRALVAMEYMSPRKNPMAHFPAMKAPKRKFRETLSEEEMKRLIARPRTDTILGLRDRAILILLYGTGIRATECSELKDSDVDLGEKIIRVIGKGGDQRTIPLNQDVVRALDQYRKARRHVSRDSYFFKSRKSAGIARNTVYERVRMHAAKAHIEKKVSPHSIRHTFATHLLRQGENLVVLRDLLGHRQISSTQIYLHMTGDDLRAAVNRHPIKKLVERIQDFLPEIKLPFQYPAGTRYAFDTT